MISITSGRFSPLRIMDVVGEWFVGETNKKHRSGQCVLFVSVTGWLGGPGRSLLTVMCHLDLGMKKVLAAPLGELSAAGSTAGCFDQQIALSRSPRWRKTSRISAATAVTTWIWRNRRDLRLIHANGLSELNLAGFGALLTRTPIVVWNHSSVSSPIAGRLARLWQLLLKDVRWSAVSPVARQVLCEAAGIDPGEARIIANPIDPSGTETKHMRYEGPTRIGFFGSATEIKGFAIIPDVVEELRGTGAVWRLFTSIPDGISETDTARRLAQMEEVVVVGRVLPAADAYADCDIVFVPSLRESFGRVPAEAMLNGLPVVATDIAAFRDLIGEGEAGFLFPPGNATKAAEALKRLIDSPPMRNRMGTVGRREVERFAPDVVLPQLLELYGLDENLQSPLVDDASDGPRR